MNKIILKSTFYRKFRWTLFLFVVIVITSCEKQKNPTCRIVYPEDYSNYGKGEIIDIEVEANDPNGNNLEIRFYIGEEGVFSTTTFPYKFSWNTDGFEEGEYIIEAKAIDAEGRNSSDSHKINITVSAPKVHTLDVQTISLTSATVGGEIVSDGGTAVTETGVYWSENENVEENGKKIRVNSINNKFDVTISGLTTNSIYYYKAYAINKMGETLGEEKGFLTLGNEIGSFTDNRDGQEYGWVRIMNQTWMSENLAYLPDVHRVENSSNLFPRYYVYDYNDIAVKEAKESPNYRDYGVLYNWVAALNACPPGWHLPTDEEWQELEMNLGMSKLNAGNAGWRGSFEGRLMKAKKGWNNGGNGSNISDFTALPGGFRLPDNTYNYKGVFGNWWTSTEYNEKDGWIRYLYYNNAGVYRGTFSKSYGYSVRCIQD